MIAKTFRKLGLAGGASVEAGLDPNPDVVRVGAVGVAVAANASGNEALAARIEEAQHEAIRQAYASGVSDPDAIRARMTEARDAVLAE